MLPKAANAIAPVKNNPWYTFERKGCSGQMVPVFKQKWPEQKKFEVRLPPPPNTAHPNLPRKYVATLLVLSDLSFCVLSCERQLLSKNSFY